MSIGLSLGHIRFHLKDRFPSTIYIKIIITTYVLSKYLRHLISV